MSGNSHENGCMHSVLSVWSGTYYWLEKCMCRQRSGKYIVLPGFYDNYKTNRHDLGWWIISRPYYHQQIPRLGLTENYCWDGTANTYHFSKMFKWFIIFVVIWVGNLGRFPFSLIIWIANHRRSPFTLVIRVFYLRFVPLPTTRCISALRVFNHRGLPLAVHINVPRWVGHIKYKND